MCTQRERSAEAARGERKMMNKWKRRRRRLMETKSGDQEHRRDKKPVGRRRGKRWKRGRRQKQEYRERRKQSRVEVCLAATIVRGREQRGWAREAVCDTLALGCWTPT